MHSTAPGIDIAIIDCRINNEYCNTTCDAFKRSTVIQMRSSGNTSERDYPPLPPPLDAALCAHYSRACQLKPLPIDVFVRRSIDRNGAHGLHVALARLLGFNWLFNFRARSRTSSCWISSSFRFRRNSMARNGRRSVVSVYGDVNGWALECTTFIRYIWNVRNICSGIAFNAKLPRHPNHL